MRLSIGQVHQSYQKWKKFKKLFRSFHVNKTLQPVAAAAYEPVQKHSQPPVYRGDLIRIHFQASDSIDKQSKYKVFSATGRHIKIKKYAMKI